MIIFVFQAFNTYNFYNLKFCFYRNPAFQRGYKRFIGLMFRCGDIERKNKTILSKLARVTKKEDLNTSNKVYIFKSNSLYVENSPNNDDSK
jgi:hypothetical protein